MKSIGDGLGHVVQRLRDRTAASRHHRDAYQGILADSRASAGYRRSLRPALYPVVGARASGSHFWDIDGNEYIDLTMGFGVQLFGHAAPFVAEAVAGEMARGLHLGPQAKLAGEVAQLICDLTAVQRLCFCNTGTEAVMTALRLARAATGRSKIAMFKWSYHSHFDGVLDRPGLGAGGAVTVPVAPGISPRFVDDLIMLDYGDLASIAILDRHASDLAAVIVEPVQSLHPELQPREFLQNLARWTKAAGVVLIFDEILLGFRIHPAGAQAHFGVDADLVTYGKILGGGFPVGVVAGRADIMAAIDGGPWAIDGDGGPNPKRTFFAGTFNKNPLTMAVARAVLTHLKTAGPDLQNRLNRRTADLAAAVNAWFAEQDMPLRLHHFGSLFRFAGRGEQELCYGLLERGVYVWEGRSCFLSTAHSDNDLTAIIDAIKGAARELFSEK